MDSCRNFTLFATFCFLAICTTIQAQTSGSLDTTFNKTGKAFFRLTTKTQDRLHIARATVATDQRIYMVGSIDAGATTGVGIVALTMNGTPDLTYDGDGIRVLSSTVDFHSVAAALQNDGKLLIGGYSENRFWIARVNTDGTLDTSWGGDGTVETQIGAGGSLIKQVIVQRDGKIIAAGVGSTDAYAVRYHPNGAIDDLFGIAGVFHHDSGGGDRIEGIVEQADNKIVFVGRGGPDGTDSFVIRVTTDGQLDPSFDNDGYLMIPATEIYAVNVHHDGKILCAVSPITQNAGVYKLNNDGSFDTSFGMQGLTRSTAQMVVEDILVRPSGEIYMAGYHQSTGITKRDFAIFGFDLNGNALECFGAQGLFRNDMGTSTGLINTTDYCFSAVMQDDGKIIMTGDVQAPSPYLPHLAIARVTTTGPTVISENAMIICEGESLTLGTQILTSPGTYSQHFQAASGCDSLAIVHLSFNPAYNISLDESICQGGAFALGDENLTVSGLHSKTFQTIHGCDSIVTVNLTVNASHTVVTSRQICKGESFWFGNDVISEAGEYQKMFSSVFGCDSLVTLTTSLIEINPGVTQNGATLVSTEQNGNYQWLGSGDEIIPGATYREFTPTESGEYAVLITRDGCGIKSEYTPVIILSAEEAVPIMAVYPNPFNETIVVNVRDTRENLRIQLQDMNGCVVHAWSVSKGSKQIPLDVNNVSDGIYVLRITTGKSIQFFRVTKSN